MLARGIKARSNISQRINGSLCDSADGIVNPDIAGIGVSTPQYLLKKKISNTVTKLISTDA